MKKNNIFTLSIFIYCILFILASRHCFAQETVLDLADNAEDATLLWVDLNEKIGNAITSGDVNGDGKDDIIISALSANGPNNSRSSCGKVYIIFGENFKDEIEVASEANLTIYGREEGDGMSSSLACGDINGDGQQDIVIGVSNSYGPSNNLIYCGEVYVIYGSSNWEKGTVLDLASQEPDITVYGAEAEDSLGFKVATGDINGDNKDDMILSAPGSNYQSGKVYIIYGKDNFDPNYVIDLSTTSADITISGQTTNDRMGYDIVSGDINGDSIDDIIIGAKSGDGPNNNRNECGEVYVIYGKTNFTPSYQVTVSTTTVDITIYGKSVYQNVYEVTCGDINNDNIQDLLIRTQRGDGPPDDIRWSCGEVYVIYGKNNWENNHVIDFGTNLPDMTIHGADSQDVMGSDVKTGDINGDTIDDIILGAHSADGPNNRRTWCGEAYTLYGGNLPEIFDLKYDSPNITVYGKDWDRFLGEPIAVGDINGDGIDDIVIGAYYALVTKITKDEIYIIYGWRPLESPTITIETRDNSINSFEIALSLHVGGDPSEMFISGDIVDSFKDTWIPYITSKDASLTGSEGTKTITAKFRNALGRESAFASATTHLNISGTNINVETNCFNPWEGEHASFIYEVSESNRVTIKIYNLAGNIVRTLLDDDRPCEIQTIEWDGRNDFGKIVTSGIYLLHIEAGSFNQIEKLFIEH